MAVELGSVHALERGDARLLLAAVLDADGILEHVGPAWQVVDKEMTDIFYAKYL